MSRCDRRAFVLFFVLVHAPVTAQPSRPPARPVDPVSGLLEAFRSHQVVALGEPHRNEQGHAFRLSLIRDPRFPGAVNDIVVECGNALYQDVIDRFIRGEEVSPADLRQVWQNTTQHLVWDSPMYEAFFRAVRDVNRRLPSERRLRVLLGDPPIDWTNVRSAADHFSWLRQRDTFPAEVIQREVLDKKRRALVIYGDRHLQRKIQELNYEASADPQLNVLVSLLERNGTRVFTIATPTNVDLATLQPGVASWPRPSLVLTRGTALGATEFSAFFGDADARVAVRDGKPAPIPRAQWRRLALEEQFDAVLYLGPPKSLTWATLNRALCGDAEYMRARRQRFETMGARNQLDVLEKECASQPSR